MSWLDLFRGRRKDDSAVAAKERLQIVLAHERIGRNPKSGDRVQVPAKHVPHFKAGKELKAKLKSYDVEKPAQ